MATAKNTGRMRQSIRDSIKQVKSMEKVSFFGRMIAPMKVSSLKTTFTASASTSGRTAESMKDNGRTTRWRVKEFSPGLMDEDTRDNTRTIRKKDSVYSHSEMAAFMKDNGKMESSTGRESLKRRTFPARVCGRMESGSSGLMKPSRTRTDLLEAIKGFRRMDNDVELLYDFIIIHLIIIQ
jgi:hypothetical protein